MTKAIGNFPYILIFSRLRNRFSLKPITVRVSLAELLQPNTKTQG